MHYVNNNTYANSIYKLQEIVNSTYSSCEVAWRQEVAIPVVEKQYATDRGAESVMTRDDYNKILEYCQDNPSKSGYAIQLQDFLGIRVEEVARIKLDNIDLDKGIIDKNFSNNGFLLEVTGKSINRQLDRIEEKLGLEKHSNHDIRRLIAQEKLPNLYLIQYIALALQIFLLYHYHLGMDEFFQIHYEILLLL